MTKNDAIALTTPRYRQISMLIREQITSGKLGVGDRLPAEKHLQAAFNVSRTVVRRAAALLEQEGVLERKGERGLIVAKPYTMPASALTGTNSETTLLSNETQSAPLFPNANLSVPVLSTALLPTEMRKQGFSECVAPELAPASRFVMPELLRQLAEKSALDNLRKKNNHFAVQLVYPRQNHPQSTALNQSMLHYLTESVDSVTLMSVDSTKRFCDIADKNPDNVANLLIFYGGYQPDSRDAEWLEQNSRHAVVIGASDSAAIPEISGDHEYGCRLAVRHFLLRGYQRIYLICGDPDTHVLPRQLVRGYIDALHEYGQPIDEQRCICQTPYIPNPIYGSRACEEFLRRTADCGLDSTAVIINGAWQTYEFINSLNKAGIDSRKLGLLVYFWSPWLDLACQQPLAGIEEDQKRLIDTAIQTLTQLVNGQTPISPQKIANLTLMIRDNYNVIQ